MSSLEAVRLENTILVAVYFCLNDLKLNLPKRGMW